MRRLLHWGMGVVSPIVICSLILSVLKASAAAIVPQDQGPAVNFSSLQAESALQGSHTPTPLHPWQPGQDEEIAQDEDIDDLELESEPPVTDVEWLHDHPALELDPLERILPKPPPLPLSTQAVEKGAPAQPLAPAAPDYVYELYPVHMNHQSGIYSTFQYTNMGLNGVNVYLNYYWPNGDFYTSEGPFWLNPNETLASSLYTLPGGHNSFVGRVQLASDEPLDAFITSPAYGMLSGQVFATDGFTPVTSDVWIEVHRAPNQDWYLGTASVLSNGSYYVGGLPDGDYNLRAYVHYPWAQQWWNNHLNNWEADVVSITGSGHTQDINFTLQPGGVIEGTVFEPNGVTPLQNMNVDLDIGWYGTCTDENGYYRIEGVPLDVENVVVTAGSDNWCGGPQQYIREYYDEVHDPNQATPIVLTAGDDQRSGIDFVLDVGGMISGVVSDAETGLPVEGIYVTARDYDLNVFSSSTYTGPDGSYTIYGLPTNDYRVQARDLDWVTLPNFARQFYDHTDHRGEAARVHVDIGSETTDIHFDLLPGGSISGRVVDQDTGQPIPNQYVDAWRTNGRSGGGTCTDEDGYFQVMWLPLGEYVITAGGFSNCNGQPNAYAKEFAYDVYIEAQADTFLVESAQPDIGPVDFGLQPGGFIEGVITDQDNNPVSDLPLEIHFPNGDCPNCYDYYDEGYTQANGAYRLGPLPENIEFAVFACTDCRGTLLVHEYYNDAYQLADATLLQVTAGSTQSNINFELTPGILLTGHVNVPLGYSAQGIRVQTECWDPIEFWSDRLTDENGDFSVPIPPISNDYWRLRLRPQGSDLEQKWADQFNPFQINQFNFNLLPGGTISGRVTTDGLPVSDVRVTAHSNFGSNNDLTDEQGYFTLANLPVGDYRIAIEDWDDYTYAYQEYGNVMGMDPPRYHLDQGEDLTGFDFEVQPATWIEGFVYESDGMTPIEGVRVTAFGAAGFWFAFTEPNGYYLIDLPGGEYKLRFEREGGDDLVPVFNGGSFTYSGAPLLTASAAAPLQVNQNMQRTATLHGHLSASDSSEALPGMHIAALNIDPAVGREAAAWTCSDENGDYELTGVWPGQTEVTVLGTCGHTQFMQPVTQVINVTSGGNHTLNLQMPRSPLADRPLTVRINGPAMNHAPLIGLTRFSYNRPEDVILPALFSPLAQLNDQGEWYPELLDRVPSATNGGIRWVNGQLEVTYVLKPGLLWSDGQPLTSADLRFTWELLRTPHHLQDTGATLYDAPFLIEAVETPNPQTAIFRYRRDAWEANAFDLIEYRIPLLYVLPEHILAGQHMYDLLSYSHFTHYPVGNGPYVVEDWLPGSHLDLRLNPNYHKRGLGLPRSSRIRLLFTGHPFYSIPGGLADGTLNIMYPEIPADYASYGLKDSYQTNNMFEAIMPNNQLPFFSEPLVRRAMYQALDRQAFADRYWSSGVLANGYLPPDHPLHNATETLYNYNLSTAAALLDTAGWTDHNGDGIRDKNGVRFEFDLAFIAPNNTRQWMATTFADDLASIGVDVNVLPLPRLNFWRKAKHGEFGAFFLGWGFDGRYSPNIYGQYHSSQIPIPTNGYNTWGMSTGFLTDAANDSLTSTMRSELNPATLENLQGQHLALTTDNLWTWPFRHSASRNFIKPTLLNFKPAGNTPLTWNIEEWWIPQDTYDLAVRKSLAADSPAPQPGGQLIYQIEVRNLGYFAMDNITLVDNLPAELSFVSASLPPDQVNGNDLIWNLGSLAGYSAHAPIRLTVEVAADATHGTQLINRVNVVAAQTDSHPENNGFIHQIEVNEDVDLAVNKTGMGLPAIGERFEYYLDYANWGGAPASGATLTDLLPPETHFVSASVPPDTINGQTLGWNLPSLLPNQWGGQIKIVAEIDQSGTVINTANIASPVAEPNTSNNQDTQTEYVDDILRPVILRPTGGTTDGTPTLHGLAPSDALVEIYDLTTGMLVGSTTAGGDGIFTLELTLAEGSYILVATATKSGFTSDYSNQAIIQVDHDLEIDPDEVQIMADGVDLSLGCVRAQRYTLGNRALDVQAVLECVSQPSARLEVTENGIYTYNSPATGVTALGGGRWQVNFRTYLGEPHSTYEIWLVWNCNGVEHRELLLYILIDPDGFLYDQSQVVAGAAIPDALIENSVVTIYQRSGDTWTLWPANIYNQTNPQTTDGTTADGVTTPGYYSFLTPSGQYRIEAVAPGYQPYISPLITVITTPVRLDIGMLPVMGGVSQPYAPAVLGGSFKSIVPSNAAVGDELTVDIYLANTGGTDSGQITLEDLLPDLVEFVTGSLTTNGGTPSYDIPQRKLSWVGVVPAGQTVHIQYRILVRPFWPGNETTLSLPSLLSGSLVDLMSLPALNAQALLQESIITLPLLFR